VTEPAGAETAAGAAAETTAEGAPGDRASGAAAETAAEDAPGDRASGATLNGILLAWAAATGAREDPPAPAMRSVSEGAVVALAEVTGETVRSICRLVVSPGQVSFVAPNAVSFAQALFEPRAWYRAITADGVPVGFLMLYDDPETPAYFLWRFMVDARYQGRGYGARAIALLAEHVRSRPGASELRTSWVPGPGGPERFYGRLGFELTGETDGEEVLARLAL
jgi:diamine N-acetyltransferase